jgi:hypothetical protein
MIMASRWSKMWKMLTITQRCGKTRSVIFFANKNAHFVSAVPKVVLQKNQK